MKVLVMRFVVEHHDDDPDRIPLSYDDVVSLINRVVRQRISAHLGTIGTTLTLSCHIEPTETP